MTAFERHTREIDITLVEVHQIVSSQTIPLFEDLPRSPIVMHRVDGESHVRGVPHVQESSIGISESIKEMYAQVPKPARIPSNPLLTQNLVERRLF